MSARARVVLSLAFCLGCGPTAALAQQTGTALGKWEIEVHGGGLLPTNPTSGTVSLPGPGQVFAIAPGPPVNVVAPSSRRESSWYFGDGAVLFNQVAASLAERGVAQFPGRIATLDPVLARSLGEWRGGAIIGVRVSRTLTPRLTAELAIDYSQARLQVTQANKDAIEATRASFISAFNGLITFNALRALNSLTSTAAVEDSGHQVLTSGTLVINLRTTGNIIPYATVGVGLISTTGATPTATLNGNYQFLNSGGGIGGSLTNAPI